MWKRIVIFIGVFLVGIATLNAYSDEISAFSSIFGTLERDSPNDWISQDQIRMSAEQITLAIPNAILTTYANTNSMDPVLDDGAHGIEIPAVEEKLRVGDIISYKSEEFDSIIVHRIISIEEDDQGTYYIMQGDNNFTRDPQRVRFDEIVGVVVGLIY